MADHPRLHGRDRGGDSRRAEANGAGVAVTGPSGRSPNRRHDRQHFYKYVSAKTAKAILTTRKLRWSSPVLFNDPFDVTQELRLDFDVAALSAALVEEMADLIIAGGPFPDTAHPGRKLIAAKISP